MPNAGIKDHQPADTKAYNQYRCISLSTTWIPSFVSNFKLSLSSRRHCTLACFIANGGECGLEWGQWRARVGVDGIGQVWFIHTLVPERRNEAKKHYEVILALLGWPVCLEISLFSAAVWFPPVLLLLSRYWGESYINFLLVRHCLIHFGIYSSSRSCLCYFPVSIPTMSRSKWTFPTFSLEH